MSPPYPATSRPSLATRYARLCGSFISDRNRLGLQGRGYTCRSMDMMPFRWRRRMRTISSSAGSSALIPSDLRIGLPYVDGLDVVQAVEVLPQESGNGQLHERLGRGIGGSGGCELHLDRPFQLLTV